MEYVLSSLICKDVAVILADSKFKHAYSEITGISWECMPDRSHHFINLPTKFFFLGSSYEKVDFKD